MYKSWGKNKNTPFSATPFWSNFACFWSIFGFFWANFRVSPQLYKLILWGWRNPWFNREVQIPFFPKDNFITCWHQLIIWD